MFRPVLQSGQQIPGGRGGGWGLIVRKYQNDRRVFGGIMGGGGPPLTRPPPSAASGGMTVSQHTQLWLCVCSCLTLSPFDVSMCVVGGGGVGGTKHVCHV